MQSFLLEIMLTVLLMFVGHSISTGAKERGIMASIAIGAVIAFEALVAGPISGASMNSARSLAPALVSGRLEHLWIYLTAPVFWGLPGELRVPMRSRSAMLLSRRKGVLRMSIKRVLFVCVENSNRSQMAQAFARIHGGTSVDTYSAGSRPSGKINPKAIAAMHEIGCDLSTHSSKSLTEVPQSGYAAAVTMGCGDACPMVQAKVREDWQIPDPREMPPGEFRKVRDLIERKVKELLVALG